MKKLRQYIAGSFALVFSCIAAPIEQDKLPEKNIETKIVEMEKKPERVSIKGKSVLVYEFSPKDISIDFITPKSPRAFGYFIGKARHEHGKNLE